MNKFICFCAIAFVVALIPASNSFGQVIASEDFDGGAMNLTQGFDENLNFVDSGQLFRRFGVWNFNDFLTGDAAPFTLGDDSLADVSGNGQFEFDFEGIFGIAKDPMDSFFCACSYDCFFDANEANRTATWVFDVSSATEDLSLCIDMGQLSDDRFDGVNAGNTVTIEYSFDGGAFQEAMTLGAVELVGSGFTYRDLDSGNNPTIDFFGDDPGNSANAGTHRGFAVTTPGVTKTLADTGQTAPNTILDKTDAATGEMDTYTAELSGSGNSLELRIIVDFSFEAFALDNIAIKTEDTGGGGMLGDVNCDGEVDLLDVAPFVALVTTGEFSTKADITMDGTVDLLDVAPFVALITGQ